MEHNQLETATDRFLVRTALERASRNKLIAFLGSPAVAGVWALTCARAREFEAGWLNPWEGVRVRPGTLLQLFYDHLWIAVHAKFGMTGLHVVFTMLLLVMVGLGTWGWAEERGVCRRFGSEAIRDLRLGDLLAASPALRVRVDRARASSPQLARESAAHPLWVLAKLVIRALPFAIAALTIALVWIALGK
jgi:hypothetical protein